MVCKRFDGKPCDEDTAPLPQAKVTFKKPFHTCGVDFAGPLYGKDNDLAVKIWIALFVCATTRAVHLEVVSSLSAEDFLLAFRRFSARRGRPSEMISDNATNFRAAAKLLAISWSFNPPAAPWFGGFYERLVRGVKSPLKKVLGQALLTVNELSALIVEVERLVNARPLTHVGGEQTWEQHPLTPNKLIGNIWDDQECAADEKVTENVNLTARATYLQKLYSHFKQRWEEEYITQLRLFNNMKKSIAEQDVVLVVDTK